MGNIFLNKKQKNMASSKSQILRMADGLMKEESVKIMLSETDLQDSRALYVDKSGELADLVEAKKSEDKRRKDEIDPVKQEVAALLDITRKGYKKEFKTLRIVANDDNYTIEQYDPESNELLGTRPQQADERPSINLFNKKAKA